MGEKDGEMTDEELTAKFDRIDRTLHQLEERLIEQMRDMQTELLKAFLPFREQTDLREQTLETRQNTLEARQSSIERRLSEIEKKLLLNPPAA
jgi:hypothetical protein